MDGAYSHNFNGLQRRFWDGVVLHATGLVSSSAFKSIVMKYVFQRRNPESEDSSDDGGTDDLDLSNIKRLTNSPFK